jgi:cell division protein FtsB
MPKKLIIIAGVIIILIITYNLINQILSTLKSGDRLQVASDELYKLELKNKGLKEKLTEVKSPDFIEGEARDKLGLARSGETVVVIPENKLQQVLSATKRQEEVRLPNWLGWFKVFWR